MTSFPNDNLNPDLCGGDLLLQICAGSPDTAIHALRDIAKHTRGGMQILWRMDGFVSPARPAGVPRNHFGFMDGIANPNVTDPEVANRLLWVVPGIGEPDWAVGGTYHVCRIIRMFIEFWDRVSLNEQQTMIGRYRASGNVLGTGSLTALPDFAADPKGKVIPLNAHIRLANPRTKATEDSRIFRRGYNYDNGVDLAGNLDMGLIFNCFQQNLARQFIANQTRLIGEPMVDYISPVGGGYFFAAAGRARQQRLVRARPVRLAPTPARAHAYRAAVNALLPVHLGPLSTNVVASTPETVPFNVKRPDSFSFSPTLPLKRADLDRIMAGRREHPIRG